MEKEILRLIDKLPGIEALFATGEVSHDSPEYKKISAEHGRVTDIKNHWEIKQMIESAIVENKKLLLKEEDSELRALIEEELETNLVNLESVLSKLNVMIVPPDPKDNCNVIMELRAGTGGDEAAIFVGDCVRMYRLYADENKWKHEILMCSPSDMGGYKECIIAFSGSQVFKMLKYEGGTHRVQRVPATESQGRVHTSAITVAVLPEPEESEELHIEDKDLRIDTYRSSGAGGQHVNVTDSAVRLTHLPTGIVVCCQDERSQTKNREKALRILKTRVLEEQEKKKQKEEASLRASQVGSGDRSERIRTYNFPQNRVTEHRINLTLYALDKVLKGFMGPLTESLVGYYSAKRFE